MNRENLVVTRIVIQLDTVDGISPGISKMSDLGYLNSTERLFLVDL